MGHTEFFPEGDQWDILNKVFSTEVEEFDFTPDFLREFPFPGGFDIPSLPDLCVNPEANNESSFHCCSTFNSNLDFVPEEPNANIMIETFVQSSCQEFPANTMSYAGVASPAMEPQRKRKLEAPESRISQSDNTNKKPRLPRDVQRKKNYAFNNKNHKDNEDQGQSSSSYSTSEEDNASQDSNGRKPRATRGCATDPQSLYARKRRERINERLRILQNLVPNGTKVDISTMLEEALHYVKFLELQIKLLSSDDLWMYAPIAYNGIDVSLNQKLFMLLSS